MPSTYTHMDMCLGVSHWILSWKWFRFLETATEFCFIWKTSANACRSWWQVMDHFLRPFTEVLKQTETKSRAPSQSRASLVRHSGWGKDWVRQWENRSLQGLWTATSTQGCSVSRPCWYNDVLNLGFYTLDSCWSSLSLALLLFIQDALEIRFDEKILCSWQSICILWHHSKPKDWF